MTGVCNNMAELELCFICGQLQRPCSGRRVITATSTSFNIFGVWNFLQRAKIVLPDKSFFCKKCFMTVEKGVKSQMIVDGVLNDVKLSLQRRGISTSHELICTGIRDATTQTHFLELVDVDCNPDTQGD